MIKIVLSRKLGELRITQTELSNATNIRRATIGEWLSTWTGSANP